MIGKDTTPHPEDSEGIKKDDTPVFEGSPALNVMPKIAKNKKQSAIGGAPTQNNAKIPELKKEMPQKHIVPVLRTFEHDSLEKMKQTKGGAELREILVKEIEKRQKAQTEYREQTKNLLKKSVILQEKHRKFLDKQRKKNKNLSEEEMENLANEMITREISKTDIANAVAKASSHMAGVDLEKNETPFSKLRQKFSPEANFTEKQREEMREKESEVKERDSMRTIWQNFEKQKEAHRQKGLKIRDIRSYNIGGEDVNNSLKKKSVFSVSIVLIVLVALIGFILLIVSQSTETPGAIPIESITPDIDVVTSEHKVSVNVTTLPEGWERITKIQGSSHIINKFIPYQRIGNEDVQINLLTFDQLFSIQIPEGLYDSFHDYYFVGNYTTKNRADGIFIFSVKDYNDALVWMLNWEKNAINGFSNVFPNTFNTSNPENTSVETIIVDNKDVRVLKNSNSDTVLLYYFFNRSILVFIAGSTDTIVHINNRIRSANSR